MKNKQNCTTCIHGFQWGYASRGDDDGTFDCHLDNSQHNSWLFVKCDKWLKRTVRNAKKFEGAFYVSAGEKYMDEQWRKIGKEHNWL